MNKLMTIMPLKFNALLRKRAWEEFPELKDSIIEKESQKYGAPDYFDEELGVVVQGRRLKKQMPEIDKPEILEEIPQVPNEENTDVLAHLSSVVKVAKILDLKNRYYLIDNLTNDRYSPVRKSLYNYHMSGLDIMHKDIAKGRDEVFKALENFQELTKIYPNSMLVKVFFNAKYREIIEIFKGAPSAEQTKAIELLSNMDPANKSFYDQIKT
jgi:hypothetical protein